MATGLTLGKSGVRDWPRPVGEVGDCGKAEGLDRKASKSRPLREPRTYGFGPGSAIRGAATSAVRAVGHRFDYKQRVVGPSGKACTASLPFWGKSSLKPKIHSARKGFQSCQKKRGVMPEAAGHPVSIGGGSPGAARPIAERNGSRLASGGRDDGRGRENLLPTSS